MTEREFYEKMLIWLKDPIESWNHITILALFCQKYQEYYHGESYHFQKSEDDITRSKEMKHFGKLYTQTRERLELKNLPSTELKRELNNRLRNYVLWLFDYKLKRGGLVQVKSTGILLDSNIHNEFNQMYTRFLAKQSNHSQMEKLVSWGQKEVKDIFQNYQLKDVNDLKIIARYVELYHLREDSPECLILKQAKSLGINYEN